MAKTKAELMAEKMQQQRVGKTAFEAGSKPAVETVTPAAMVPAGINEEEKVTPPSAPETKTEKPTEPVAALADLLGTIGEEKKPARRSASLYLSDSNLAELKKRSKAAGLSASEYLDQLLAKIFG